MSGAGPSRPPGGGRREEPDFFSALFGSGGGLLANVNIESLFNMGNLPPRVRTHVRNVFLTLLGMTFVFTIGILLRLNFPLPLALSGAISFASIMALNFMSRTQENLRTRMGLLAVTALTTGISTGDLVGYAFNLNPMIVVQAAVATVLSFGSFALSALTAERRSWLFLGGGIGSFLSVTLILQLLASFFGRALDMITIWIGLIGLLGFVLFDTQIMIERAHTQKGWLDPVHDSQQLFVDLVGIFQRLMILLSERETKRQREEEDRKRRGKRE